MNGIGLANEIGDENRVIHCELISELLPSYLARRNAAAAIAAGAAACYWSV